MKTNITIKSLLRSIVSSTLLAVCTLTILFSCSGKSNADDEAYYENTTDVRVNDSIRTTNAFDTAHSH